MWKKSKQGEGQTLAEKAGVTEKHTQNRLVKENLKSFYVIYILNKQEKPTSSRRVCESQAACSFSNLGCATKYSN